MEAVRAKELAEQKAKKKSIPKQDDDKFDALGNKIETAVAAADIDRDYVKKLTKQLKALKERVKKVRTRRRILRTWDVSPAATPSTRAAHRYQHRATPRPRTRCTKWKSS